MRPLKLRLQRPADAPVRVAKVIVDGRIFRLEIDRALQRFDRVGIVADAELRPAE